MTDAGPSTRYGVARAPDGLGFVEDFLNTVGRGTPPLPDQLASVPEARAWLQVAVQAWAADREQPPPKVALTSGDVAVLRVLRDDLHEVISRSGSAAAATRQLVGTADFRLTRHGRVMVIPSGRGSSWVAAAVALEMREAHVRGSRVRLKVCANPVCAVAFYDRSRNNSGVWHDVRVCGNAINLRAYRARRAAVEG